MHTPKAFTSHCSQQNLIIFLTEDNPDSSKNMMLTLLQQTAGVAPDANLLIALVSVCANYLGVCDRPLRSLGGKNLSRTEKKKPYSYFCKTSPVNNFHTSFAFLSEQDCFQLNGQNSLHYFLNYE